MSTDDLPHLAPSAAGADAAGISAFLDALEADPRIDPHGIVILKGGAVIAEGCWAPHAADDVRLMYSLSKSFTSTAAGLARAEGLLELDSPVISYFPELDAEFVDEGARAMTVRHIGSMASGHASDTIDAAYETDQANLVRGFLLTPLDAEPGTIFAYNQPCTYTLASIVQRGSRQTLVDYLRPRLFAPLGIREASWVQEPEGVDLGFSGLHTTIDAVARLGELYLRGGEWRGVRVLDADWVVEASRVQVANPDEGNPDWCRGYGLQFWLSQHGFRGDGAYGQFCLVLPEQDAVVAITSQTEAMQAVLDRAWELLVPALASPGSAEADAALATRLGSLVAPVPATVSDAPDGFGDELAFTVPEPIDPFDIALAAVRLERTGAGWTLHLTQGDATLSVPVAREWTRSEPDGVPVAAAGGGNAAGGFEAELRFLATPHAIRVVCGADGVAHVRWVTVPLHSRSLHAQRRP